MESRVAREFLRSESTRSPLCYGMTIWGCTPAKPAGNAAPSGYSQICTFAETLTGLSAATMVGSPVPAASRATNAVAFAKVTLWERPSEARTSASSTGTTKTSRLRGKSRYGAVRVTGTFGGGVLRKDIGRRSKCEQNNADFKNSHLLHHPFVSRSCNRSHRDRSPSLCCPRRHRRWKLAYHGQASSKTNAHITNLRIRPVERSRATRERVEPCCTARFKTGIIDRRWRRCRDRRPSTSVAGVATLIL